jgi:hypothetical protein
LTWDHAHVASGNAILNAPKTALTVVLALGSVLGVWAATHPVDVGDTYCGTVFTQSTGSSCDGALRPYSFTVIVAAAISLASLALLARSLRVVAAVLVAATGAGSVVFAADIWTANDFDRIEGPDTQRWFAAFLLGGIALVIAGILIALAPRLRRRVQADLSELTAARRGQPD